MKCVYCDEELHEYEEEDRTCTICQTIEDEAPEYLDAPNPHECFFCDGPCDSCREYDALEMIS